MGQSKHFATKREAEKHLLDLGYRQWHSDEWKNESVAVPMGQRWVAMIHRDVDGFYCEFATRDGHTRS